MIVGDTAVGKSCLIDSYLYNRFNENYAPTIKESYKGTKKVNDEMINLLFADTSGDEH